MSYRVVVSKDCPSGIRLDSYIAKELKLGTRSTIKKLIEEGKVELNQKVAKASSRVRAGDVISVELLPPKPSVPGGENIPLKILYEDEHLVVVDKPAGLITHPTPGKMTGTLVNALLYHCKDLSGIGGVLKPGIVHRLDKLTSGVMVVAKSDRAHTALSEQFKKHSVERKYLALVWGDMEKSAGTFSSFIGRSSKNRMKMAQVRGRGKFAITHWKVLRRYRYFSLVECKLDTGRTHQIRVHFSANHHPVVGDPDYGRHRNMPAGISDELERAIRNLNRQALHAYKLGFIHPVSGEYMEFESSLPDEIESIIRLMEKQL